jgi:hypothetical protein
LPAGKQQIFLNVPRSIPFEDGVLQIVQSVPAQPWDGGLSSKQTQEQIEIARVAMARLAESLKSHREWANWQQHASGEYRWLKEQCLQDPQWLSLAAARAPVKNAAARAAERFRTVIDTVIGRAYPVYVNGELTAATPICPFVVPRAHEWKDFVLNVLRAARLPLDEWHQATTLALLFSPELAELSVTLGFWLAPRPAGQSDLERPGTSFVGAPDKTDRAAGRARRVLQQDLGFQRWRRPTGPVKGSQHGSAADRDALVQHIRRCAAKGVAAKQIALEANALALYRTWRGDQYAPLSAKTVRRLLKSTD